MSDETTINVKGLDQLLKALKTKPPVCRVGVLGEKDARTGKVPSNASVGAAHEFGTSKMTKRSFLRMPLTDHLSQTMESYGLTDQDTLKAVVKEGSIRPWLLKVAKAAETTVAEAFATGGFGKWAPWKNENYTNNTGEILTDTKQLRDSITSEVK